jgi:hypothetical protein
MINPNYILFAEIFLVLMIILAWWAYAKEDKKTIKPISFNKK